MLRQNELATYVVVMVAKLSWQPQGYVNNSFILRCMKFMFGMAALQDNGG